MRSALSLFQNAIPKEAFGAVADEMRWVAGELGLARDLDVFISEGLAAVAWKLPLVGADRLQEIAERRRKLAYEEQVQGMLDSERYRLFKEDLDRWISTRAWESATFTKKQSKRLRGLEKLMRKAAKGRRAGADEYLARHKRANRRKKNGWARKLPRNLMKAQRKALKATFK